MTVFNDPWRKDRCKHDLLFELSNPEDVLSTVVQDRQQRHVFALFQGVWIGGDCPHFGDLKHKQQDSSDS